MKKIIGLEALKCTPDLLVGTSNRHIDFAEFAHTIGKVDLESLKTKKAREVPDSPRLTISVIYVTIEKGTEKKLRKFEQVNKVEIILVEEIFQLKVTQDIGVLKYYCTCGEHVLTFKDANLAKIKAEPIGILMGIYCPFCDDAVAYKQIRVADNDPDIEEVRKSTFKMDIEDIGNDSVIVMMNCM